MAKGKIIIVKKQTGKKPAVLPAVKKQGKKPQPSSKVPKVRDNQNSGARIDWSIIKTAYVTDPKATTRGLAKKFGVSDSAVAKHCKNEGWAKERQEYIKKTEDNSIEAAGEDREQLIRKLNKKHSGMFDLIADKLKTATEKLSNDVWISKNLESLAKAAKHVMEAERLINGLPSDVKGLSDPRGDKLTVTIESLHEKAKQVLNDKNTNS